MQLKQNIVLQSKFQRDRSVNESFFISEYRNSSDRVFLRKWTLYILGWCHKTEQSTTGKIQNQWSLSFLTQPLFLLAALGVTTEKQLPSYHSILSILLCHSSLLHVLLHCIHQSSLCSSCFPTAWKLHIQHSLSSVSIRPYFVPVQTMSALPLYHCLLTAGPELSLLFTCF